MTPRPEPGAEARLALAAGIGCYLIWGFVPLAFQLMGRMGLSPWEIVAHRTIWAAPVALAFVLVARQGRQVLAVLGNLRVMGWLTLSAALIGANWLLYIWAVNSGRVLETSLGYYINPLLAMAAGALIFGERIDRIGLVAIALASIGVIIQTLALGHLPLVSLALGISFCGYAVVRKRVAADAQTGLLIECMLLAGPSLVYAIWLQNSGGGNFGADVSTTAWLLACGPLTATPLMLFAWAARRIPLSFMGFLQFMGPTIGFGIGISQGEAFTPVRAASFVFIWGGAAVYALGTWRRSRAVQAVGTAPL